MVAQLLWWTANALEALLLIRSVRGGFFKRYPLFYLYLSYVLLESLLRFYVFSFKPGFYQIFYWRTQLLSVALGYGVIWEIFRQALARYPGASRIARSALSAVFVAVVSKTFVNMVSGPAWSLAKTTAEFERNLRTVQAIFLAIIVVLIAYYVIPTGRNLKGMILGYGFFIGTRVISLTLRSSFGNALQLWWQYLPSMTYLVTLLIWGSTLWSYQGNPQPKLEVGLDHDYEFLAGRTTKLLGQVRTHLMRAIRP